MRYLRYETVTWEFDKKKRETGKSNFPLLNDINTAIALLLFTYSTCPVFCKAEITDISFKTTAISKRNCFQTGFQSTFFTNHYSIVL